VPASIGPVYRAEVTDIGVTGIAQKEAWANNVLPPVEKVRPGLWSIPVPMVGNPLRYVSVYALELDDGVALIDAGWNTDDAFAALVDGLAVAGGTLADVRAVLVTHIHPDHYGLAGRVREASGAWVALHPADAKLIESRYATPDQLVENMSRLLAVSGVPEDKRPDLSQASMEMRMMVALAQPDVLLEDEEKVDLPGWPLRTVWTPGHSPGHICFWSDREQLLLAGDHILPRITPIISYHSQQFPNPLGNYLESLAKVRDLPAHEVLPAHEYRFANLAARVDELVHHHETRLDAIEGVVARQPGISSWDLTVSLQWSRSWDEIPIYMQRAANGETLAHLILLEANGRLRRVRGIPDRWYSDR
jgi:glyoxylase-like metal-dependent hydrolase (beta-lactamase superfamily II)